MPLPIEDYALIGDCVTAALVGRNGSIDWLCLPRFDSGACFAALLGTPDHGRWKIAPKGDARVRRWYRAGTLILETELTTDDGVVSLVDFMPPRDERADLVRLVIGRRGRVPMHMDLAIRFDYGSIVPWVRRIDHTLQAIAGPDMLRLETPIRMHGQGLRTVADFVVAEGDEVPFVLTWQPSHVAPLPPIDARQACARTEAYWKNWADRCTHDGDYAAVIRRSLLVLKALTHAPTGGVVAAPTTSLPERIGGVRNWDYRLCWVRDAAFTLYALLDSGYREEAIAWRDWLLRAVAGEPSQLQIMYGVAGERRLTEMELDWLPGYEGSSPVRVGNAAYRQLQLDVYGELADVLHLSYESGLEFDEAAWALQRALLNFLETTWHEPDEGIWEVRGPRRHFTHSKVMAWVAFDRAVKLVERFGFSGPIERWRARRAEVHDEVCRKGFDPSLGAFVQSYGSKQLDASLLVLPIVGFLPPEDPRVRGTVDAIEKGLVRDGFVLRYVTEEAIDGLPRGEGTFLPCTAWLAEVLALLGRFDEARAFFERVLSVCNDVGLASEEYDPQEARLLGNFPQAFTHVALINAARALSRLAPSKATSAGSRGSN